MDVASIRLPDARHVSLIRIAIGVVSILAPGLTAAMIGVPRADGNRSLRTIVGLFGVREVVIGVTTIAALDADADHRRICLVNAAVDGGDAVVLVRSIRRDGLTRLTAALPLSLAIVANWLRLASADQ